MKGNNSNGKISSSIKMIVVFYNLLKIVSDKFKIKP